MLSYKDFAGHARRLLAIAIVALPTAAFLLAAPADAGSQFPACAMKAIQDLDDGISPADVIAAAVVQECRWSWITKDCNSGCEALLVNNLKTFLLPEVLKFRAAKRVGKPNG